MRKLVVIVLTVISVPLNVVYAQRQNEIALDQDSTTSIIANNGFLAAPFVAASPLTDHYLDPVPGESVLPDGNATRLPTSFGPSIMYDIQGGKLTSLIISAPSSGKQAFSLSCEEKVAGQIAAMYDLPFTETSFISNLPHSLDPRLGFVGSIDGLFDDPRSLIGNSANGPGGFGVYVEGWSPTFQKLSHFGVQLLASDSATAGAQIDNALRHGEPIAVWAIVYFRPPDASRSVWLRSSPNGTAVDCGGPGKSCVYLASGEHNYLIVGRTGNAYLIYNPGNGLFGYFPRDTVLTGITDNFAALTGSSPGAIIIPTAGHIPDLSQLPNWG